MSCLSGFLLLSLGHAVVSITEQFSFLSLRVFPLCPQYPQPSHCVFVNRNWIITFKLLSLARLQNLYFRLNSSYLPHLSAGLFVWDLVNNTQNINIKALFPCAARSFSGQQSIGLLRVTALFLDVASTPWEVIGKELQELHKRERKLWRKKKGKKRNPCTVQSLQSPCTNK